MDSLDDFKKDLEHYVLPKTDGWEHKDRESVRNIIRKISDMESANKAFELLKELNIEIDLNEFETSRQKETPKKKEKEEEETPQTSLVLTDDFMAEQVFDGLKIQFCIYNFKTGEVTYADEFNGFQPINAEEVFKKAVLLPSRVEEYGTDDELDEKIKAFVCKWLDIPEDMVNFGLWDTKRSWVFEQFHTLNYLRALGSPGFGKTRFLDVFGNIHYKPIMTSGATTAAPIFRIIDRWRGTMVIDEADFKSSEESVVIIKIINQGYERGKFIMRCDQSDAESIRFFDPYCPKIIATRKPFEDKATESRCITQVMMMTSREDIPPNLNKEFFEEAQTIRNMLLLWRFRNYKRVGEIIIKFDYSGLEPRLKQIVTSLINLFGGNPEQLEAFKDFILEQQAEIISERQNSWEGEVVMAIHSLVERGERDISAADIVFEGGLVNDRGQPLHPRALNKVLKELGFGKVRVKRLDGDRTKRCLPLVQKQLDELFKRYDVTKVTLVTETEEKQKNFKNDDNFGDTLHP